MSYLRIQTPFSSNDEENPLVTVTFNSYIGKSWSECGIAQVHRFLETLGFGSPDEVQALCDSTNVFELFGDKSFVEQRISDADRQLLPQVIQAARTEKMIPQLFPFKSRIEVFKKTNPDYTDFFQFLFTWLTSANEGGREGFIKWWEDYDPKPPMRNEYISITFTVYIRKQFKDKVEDFLDRRRNPSKYNPTEKSDSTPFMDVIHYIKSAVLKYAFKEANWDYISGNAASVSGSLPGVEASIGGGGGNFYVFNKENPKVLQELRFGTVNLGIGLGISSPISVAIDPAVFPTVGKIYHGLFQEITGFRSFEGNYISVNLGASNGVNINTALIFIGTKSSFQIKLGGPGNELSEMLLNAIKDSNAVISVDGHGLETSLVSIGGQFSTGIVARGNLIRK